MAIAQSNLADKGLRAACEPTETLVVNEKQSLEVRVCTIQPNG
jgi:hypothetical protein